MSDTDRNSNLAFSRVPGMPCPECRQPIVVDPHTLLSAQPVRCAACGLELRLNLEQSAGTLAALQTYMHQLEEIGDRVGAEQPASPARTRRRRPGRRPRTRRSR